MLPAPAMNRSRLSASNFTSPTERSSNINVNPPDVPSPGIAGGEKPNATVSGSLLNSWFNRALIAWKQEALVESLADRLRLAYLGYNGGVYTQLNALDADRDLFESELDLARIRL
jgi:hypothetical protein